MSDKIQRLVEEAGIDKKVAEKLVEGFESLVEVRAVEIAKEKIDEAKERYKEKVKALNEEVEQRIEEGVKEKVDVLVESIEKTLDMAFSEWAEKNADSLKDAAIVEAARNVIEGARDIKLFEQHKDIRKRLMEKYDENSTTQRLYEETIAENAELKRNILEYQKAVLVLKRTAHLSEAKRAKVVDMLELVESKDLEHFERALELVLEEVAGEAGNDGKKTDVFFEKEEEKTSTDGEAVSILGLM